MILKSFEIDNKKVSKLNCFLLYGENEGLKKEITKKLKHSHPGKEIKYEEDQILKNKNEFFIEIKNKSLFEEKKIFILERCTDKIAEIIIEICENKIEDLIIINCGILEKRTKLRKYFEQSNNVAIIPTYKDNSQSLSNIAKNFFYEKKISISYETLNLLINRSNGDRGYLQKELEKISNYLSDKKIVSLKEISVLTNLSENYSASELVDASLCKNIVKTREILSENNYSREDTFLILRVFLNKTKKILNLLEKISNEKDMDKVISEHKPPIFWKEKPTIKKQLEIWSLEGIKNLIRELNDIEIKAKKQDSISLILMKNFVYDVIDQKTNNPSLSTR